jgi:mannitol-1-phosphate 5-dehydrogenase
MPTLVQIGAGNIGRGFIAPLFTAAGWKVVFVDINPRLVAELNQRGSFTVREVDNHGESSRTVTPVQAIHVHDAAAVVAALAVADLAATAVGLPALSQVGPLLAAAAAQRTRPLDVLVCENGLDAQLTLRAAVDPASAAKLGFVRTSISRMIPAPGPEADLLDIAVEPFGNLPVERAAFRGDVPAVRGIDAAEDFELIIRQKLYLNNLTHACLAYAGARKGYTSIAECAADHKLAASVRSAGFEAAEALARAHARSEVERARLRRENRDLVDDLLERYGNRQLVDPVTRVGRDPWRKLAADDRLVGAARLGLAHGVHPTAILRHILDACAWQPVADEPQAERWRELQARGPQALLAAVTGLPTGDPFLIELAATLRDARRQAAARALKAAGILVTPVEAQAIVVEDFALGRFDQLGRAVLSYTQDTGCCARDWVLLPGQLVPELVWNVGSPTTYRCRAGEAHLYRSDVGTSGSTVGVPADKQAVFTAERQCHLRPGDQQAIPIGVRHWWVAGPHGVVISEFAARPGEADPLYTDPAISD